MWRKQISREAKSGEGERAAKRARERHTPTYFDIVSRNDRQTGQPAAVNLEYYLQQGELDSLPLLALSVSPEGFTGVCDWETVRMSPQSS